jgi:hypothetical protein
MTALTIQKLSARIETRWASLQVRCAQGRAGRVLLHLLCACGDHQVRWHLQGIARELAGQFPLFN